MSARKIWWNDFSAFEFKNLDPMKTIAILPVAAVEQHGPHLPVGTDTIINQGHLDLLVKRAPANLDIRILPVQAIGKSNEHIWQVGTVSHTANNLIDAWLQVGLEVARSGIKKLVFVNSHGGNVAIIEIVARELRVRADMLAVKTGWGAFGDKSLFSDIENRYGIHGGDAETSLVMHFRPELINHQHLQNYPSVAPRDEQEYKHLRPIGSPTTYAWIASDIHPLGTAGEAHLATPEKGEAYAESAVAGFIEMLREVERYPLPGIGD